MNHLSRREMLQLSLMGLGSLFIPSFVRSSPMPSQTATDPHFFLKIVLGFGADNSYMFDARPLSMTQAGKIQNYTATEPIPYTAQNGGFCRVSSAFQPMLDFRDDLCVVNGVVMATTFDGHDQNMNYLFTGNPFGGESFVPHLNLKSASLGPMALDAVQQGFLFTTISNGSATVPLQAGSAQMFGSRLAQIPVIQPTELSQFIRSRVVANAQGPGRFASGSRQLLAGLDAAPNLHERLQKININVTGTDLEADFVSMLTGLFQNQITRSAIYVPGQVSQYDTHAFTQAKDQPTMFANTAATLAKILKTLKATAFDSTRSMLDVTTVMITSEFGRTMRIEGFSIDQTGTNHNPLNNSVLLAGKGIKGGQVIGSSDLPDETAVASKAHAGLDRNLEKLMGRPFDFQAQISRADTPEVFDIKEYLTINSVINTVYSLFDVPQSMYRIVERMGPVAPIVASILK